MSKKKNTRSRHARMIGRSLVWLVVLALVLPLIPYALAYKDTVPGAVPNPGTTLWEDVRQRNAPVSGQTQVGGVDAGILINPYGETWRVFRMQYLVPGGAILAGVVLALISLVFLVRGSMRIPGGESGEKLLRFTAYERIVHWFVVALFWLLGLTGLILLYGRFVLIPLLGPEGFSVTASASKEAHNLFGPLFLVAILMLLAVFIKDNLYARGDLKWLLKGGGMFGGHASAGRFNAGVKIWFWLAVLGGIVLSVTGLILEFAILGQPRVVMGGSHALHGIAALVLIVVSFGHTYLATIGMEGSLNSMTNGYVDANWAKAHHDRWYQEMTAGEGSDSPAEERGAGDAPADGLARPVPDN